MKLYVKCVFITIMLAISQITCANEWVLTDKGYKVISQKHVKKIIWSGSSDNKGYANGPGILRSFKNGKLYCEFQGFLLHGKEYGKGTLSWTNGDRLETKWVNGVPNGKAVYVWENGDRYEGDICNGKRTGKGIFLFHNGGYYEGNYINGKWHGKGFLTLNGNQYLGNWAYGLQNGKGMWKYKDGTCYIGNFIKGKRQGYGILYSSKKKIIYKGKWFEDSTSTSPFGIVKYFLSRIFGGHR